MINWRPSFEDGLCFGLYNLLTQSWALDCFDYPRRFVTRAEAENYKPALQDASSFEVRLYEP